MDLVKGIKNEDNQVPSTSTSWDLPNAAKVKAVPPEVKVEPQSSTFSKNCKNFNRLFHASFDDDSSSSFHQQEFYDSTLKLDTSEILLEIEIETQEESLCESEPQDPTSSIINLFQNIKSESSDLVDGETVESSCDMELNLMIKSEAPVLSNSSGKRKKNGIGERKSNRLSQTLTNCKTQEAQIMRQITLILKKESMTDEDKSLLDAFPTLVRIVRKRVEARLLSTQRLKEFEDSPEDLEDKCNQLAEIISSAKYLVVYSGAGISTSANIPDFRGTTGLWTLLKNGQGLDSQNLDTQVLTSADPTLTHMAIKQLYAEGIVKHVVSQNCDGLHLRSGIPKMGLSEIHGNMYIEVCTNLKSCGREFVRTFDVAENTRRHEHRTGRRCYNCRNPLRDTIVHFGERGRLRWPINWAGAEYNAHRADVILCIGSSLKVLRRYPWLWCMDKPASKRPKLVIVNLMWTPKDSASQLKINGRCDEVMRRVMDKLKIFVPAYSRLADPLFRIATPLHLTEIRTRSCKELAYPENEPYPVKLVELNNYIRFEPIFRLSSNANSSNEESDSESSKDKPKEIKTRASGNGPKVPTKKKNRIIKKVAGNGGWLGNLAPGVKMKKRKVK